MEHANIVALTNDLIGSQQLLFAVFSDPISPEPSWGQKVTVRPVNLKNTAMYQITSFKGPKTFHKNLTKDAFQHVIAEILSAYKHIQLFSVDADLHITRLGEEYNMRRHKPTRKVDIQAHDREKKHLLPEGQPDAYLIGLGLMTAAGKIISSKTHKYRQINRFLELVCHTLDGTGSLHIVDLGCGKAYLTFALYHYLREIKGVDVRLTGVDIKDDVIADCRKLAQTLRYQDLKFVQGTIDSFEPESKVDVVVALHACNTATDHALAKGVQWGADYLFAAPCCQHELYAQIHSPPLQTLFRHGILKERCAALITDAARAELLEAVGYRSQIVEFIDLEHSPKNLLLRAHKEPSADQEKRAWERYLELKRALGISPTLERLLDLDSRGHSSS